MKVHELISLLQDVDPELEIHVASPFRAEAVDYVPLTEILVGELAVVIAD